MRGQGSRQIFFLNMPLLAMMYPRGPEIANPRDAGLIAHAATLAADLGADIVKTPCAYTIAEMADITRDCPVPLVVAGGPRRPDADAVLSYVDDALRGGVAGVAMGRNVFAADDPGAMTRLIADRIHRRPIDPVLDESGQLELAAV